MCPFPRMLFLRSLFMGLVSQGHCLQLPSLWKSAQVPHPGVVCGCPQPMRLQTMPLSLITVKRQPGSGSLCLWSPWDETTVGTLALESPVSPPWHVLVPWQAPLHEGKTWLGVGGGSASCGSFPVLREVHAGPRSLSLGTELLSRLRGPC